MKYKFTSTIILLLDAFLLTANTLSGRNTIKGAGQDLQSAGQAIERKAEQKKPY